jgi:hypothetical protein
MKIIEKGKLSICESCIEALELVRPNLSEVYKDEFAEQYEHFPPFEPGSAREEM